MMKMPTGDRAWIFGGIGGLLLLSVLAWFFAINPQLSHANSLRSQTDDTSTQNISLQAKTAKLAKQDADRSTLTAQLQAALGALPSDPGLPNFIRQLNAAANVSRVTVTGVTVGSTTLATGPSAGTNAGAASVTNSAGQLFSIPVTVTSLGTLSGEQAFLATAQQTGPRRVLVTSTSFIPAAGALTSSISGLTTMTAQLQIFVAPQSEAKVAQLQQLVTSKSAS
jgi:hypothetical protein